MNFPGDTFKSGYLLWFSKTVGSTFTFIHVAYAFTFKLGIQEKAMM